MPFACLRCVGGEHGHDCQAAGCACRCRSMLGLDGPFPEDAPDPLDQLGVVE
jgi:hypothetical protein